MGELEKNRIAAQRLGWSPGDFGQGGFDAALVAAIRAFQRAAGEKEDGVCGPRTYRALLGQRLEGTATACPPPDSSGLARCGEIAVWAAKALWLETIVDPPSDDERFEESRRKIDGFIRSPDGLSWEWEARYGRDGDFEWCGAFVARAWRAATLELRWRRAFFASTYRIDRWGRYMRLENASNDAPAAVDRRRQWLALDETSGPAEVELPDGSAPRAGDILLVGGENTDYGKHVTLVEAYDPETASFTTLEGNATGPDPSGRRIHGVVRRTRRVGLSATEPRATYHARRLIRPGAADLAG